MQKLQEFIYNTLLFAQAVGAHIKDLRTRVYNLELINLKPVQYVNQVNTALERSIARNNIRTNAIFSGATDPNTINWGVLYEGMPLRNGDKYIQQDFAGGIREEYTYFVGDGTVLPTWLKVTQVIPNIAEVKKKEFEYIADNVFDIEEPVLEILDVIIDNGANFDNYVIGFTKGDTTITLDDSILYPGNKVKFIYKK